MATPTSLLKLRELESSLSLLRPSFFPPSYRPAHQTRDRDAAGEPSLSGGWSGAESSRQAAGHGPGWEQEARALGLPDRRGCSAFSGQPSRLLSFLLSSSLVLFKSLSVPPTCCPLVHLSLVMPFHSLCSLVLCLCLFPPAPSPFPLWAPLSLLHSRASPFSPSLRCQWRLPPHTSSVCPCIARLHRAPHPPSLRPVSPSISKHQGWPGLVADGQAWSQ